MSRNSLFASALILIVANVAAAQVVIPGPNGPTIVPPQRFIPLSEGQFPVYVTPNEVVGVNPTTGGLDTQNRQIDNTAYQYGRHESQFNGTKRWVRRPVHNAQGQVVGYQEGWVWRNSYTGQEHGELVNYTPNNLGGVNNQHQSRSVGGGGGGGVHKNIQTFDAPQGGVHRNRQSFSPAPGAKAGGVHKNIQSFSVQGR